MSFFNFKSIIIILSFFLYVANSWAQISINRGGDSLEKQYEDELPNQRNFVNNQGELLNDPSNDSSSNQDTKLQVSENAISTEAVASPNAVSSLAAPICKMESYVKPIQGAKRFEVVYDGGAVLDKETGLIWQRDIYSNQQNAYFVESYCYGLKLGGRGGWRLPRPEELMSVGDVSSIGKKKHAIQDGHPFELPNNSSLFWTSEIEYDTMNATNKFLVETYKAMLVDMALLNPYRNYAIWKQEKYNYWCVRKF